MKAPLSWLKDYVDIDVSAQELQQKLFSCGFEVEELVYVGAEIDRCVVGRIEKLERHPDADKLQICRINCGSYGEDIQIVTGATNVFEGALVPVALDNSSLHGGVKIKKGKLRGVESCGMLCSGEELGINDDWYDGADVNGILILQGDIPLGTDIKKVVGLDDYIFDIAVTSNRPDCQSIYGIAREVAAVLHKPVEPVPLTYHMGSFCTSERVNIAVQAPDLCPRYIGHYVRDIKIGRSPLWMRRRLALCGLRSINNVVDITNFVLLELGQPMHAFDLSRIADSRICVRRAREGEEITTLDEKDVQAHGREPRHRRRRKAGRAGGRHGRIEQRHRRNDARASLRERQVRARQHPPHFPLAGPAERLFLSLRKGGGCLYDGRRHQPRPSTSSTSLAAGQIACDRFDIAVAQTPPQPIATTAAQINALLGIEVPQADIVGILESLNFNVEVRGDALSVTPPAYREDVDGYPDLAEEVIREYGYDHIEGTFLRSAAVTNGGLNAEQRRAARAKRALHGQDFSEIITYSFISPKDYALLRLDGEVERAIRIRNPIGEDMSVMRTTLAPSMLHTLVRNIRRGNDGRPPVRAGERVHRQVPSAGGDARRARDARHRRVRRGRGFLLRQGGV